MFNKNSGNVLFIMLDDIRRDGGTQPRVSIDWKHVKVLEEQMSSGEKLEPVILFQDSDGEYWLADGFHKWHAYRNLEEDSISCIVYQGSVRDAILYSVGANANNKPALPRGQKDKRKAIMTLLNDPEWSRWSDREIARQCRVSDKTVGALRKSICGISADTKLNNPENIIYGNFDNSADTNLNEERKAKRAGKEYTMYTSKIGKKLQMEAFDADKPELAHHLKLVLGGLVRIHVSSNDRINARLGRIKSVEASTIQVWVRDVERMAMHFYTLKHKQVEIVPIEEEPQLFEVCKRLERLRRFSLDPFEVSFLDLLDQPVVFTPTELEYLSYVERRYSIAN
jgi:ParB-like nuclease domain